MYHFQYATTNIQQKENGLSSVAINPVSIHIFNAHSLTSAKDNFFYETYLINVILHCVQNEHTIQLLNYLLERYEIVENAKCSSFIFE